MSYANIALFIPHQGCPHQCSFCNQKRITGQQTQPTGEDVKTAVETAISSGRCSRENTEIAFFGGSFTAVAQFYQEELLSAAFAYIKGGFVKGIRISTRPDCIDEATLRFLKNYGVTSIELGAQSMVDRVLIANHRGHTAQQVAEASKQIRMHGFSLGLQMMTGLYQSTAADDRYTAEQLEALQPDTVRIYPTIVMEDTALADLYRAGVYQPPELTETVALCSELLDFFEQHQRKVIRLGLHSSEELEHRIAGPYHPAFAELCHSHRFLQALTAFLQKENVPNGAISVCVEPRFLSKAIGQGKSNQRALMALGYDCKFFGDPAIAPGKFRLVQ